MREYEDEHFGLVMPFIACRSQGGEFDDDAFVSGWRCGAVDALLAWPETVDYEVYAREHDLAQLDLIAMRRGFVMTNEPSDDGWLNVTFQRAPANATP